MRLPCGTFSRNYFEDNAILRTRTHWLFLILGLILAFAIPAFANNYVVHVLVLIFIYIIASQGLNILTGYCGQISIAHAAFLGVGAYTSAILVTGLHLSFWLALPLAGLVTGLVGALFGFPALRLKGFYLLMSTLAAHFIIVYVMSTWSSVTGGRLGYMTDHPAIGNFIFNTDRRYYYLALVVLLFATYFSRNLIRSKVGRAFIAIRDNDLAAEVIGINLSYYKVLAFFIGCFYAGIAGSLWAHWILNVMPEQYTLMGAVWFLGYIIVGGMGTTLGPFLGVFTLVILGELLNVSMSSMAGSFPTIVGKIFPARDVLFGLIIMLVFIFEPRGLAHRWDLFKAYYRLWPFSY